MTKIGFKVSMVLLTACLLINGDAAAGEGKKTQRLINRIVSLNDAEPIFEDHHRQRTRRSPDDLSDDYSDDEPEGRHLHKLKHKLKPHKFGHHGGGGGGYFGGSYPVHGHQGGGGGGLFGCRKLHGCGGGFGWHKPYGGGGGGPIAAAFAGPSYGYGGNGWNNRPFNAQSQFGSWNLGPFQASYGFAHAG